MFGGFILLTVVRGGNTYRRGQASSEARAIVDAMDAEVQLWGRQPLRIRRTHARRNIAA
jgi:hypothetical protein